MPLKSKIINLFANQVRKRTQKKAASAIADQDKWLAKLVAAGQKTSFGKDHGLERVKHHAAFVSSVPIRGYEELKPYIDKVLNGEVDVLWPGKPAYLAKTSGTTSGVKYIPISKDSIGQHIKTARNSVFNFLAESQEDLFSGKMIFISGSPELESKAGIKTGRLSGIVNHEMPSWITGNKLPSYKTNCIADWETKLDKIVEETYNQDMRLISGIPPWVQMYYERLLLKTGKTTIKEVFPNLKAFIHGGVNYQPYKSTIDQLHGTGVMTLETYPASEGFIAYQNDLEDESLLLNTDAGMYFEFVPLGEISQPTPSRFTLREVELDKDYAVIITSNAGLWAYNIGDTIRFTSLDPFKIKVSGRIKHFISAFGEHVIAKEVEEAIQVINAQYGLKINEFTVAPQVNPSEGLPYHEWFIEFDEQPSIPLVEIAQALDKEIIRQNIYYKDLIDGQILQSLIIRPLPKGAYRQYMKSIGKLGGQNKVPRLMNNRSIANVLSSMQILKNT